MGLSTRLVQIVIAGSLALIIAACSSASRPKPIKTNRNGEGVPTIATPTPSASPSPSPSHTILGPDEIEVILSDGSVTIVRWDGQDHLDTTGKFKISKQ